MGEPGAAEARPGEPDIPGAWTPVRIQCPRCRVIHASRVRRFVAFPGDAETVLAIAEGRGNVLRCPSCGLQAVVDAPVLVVRADPPVVAVLGLPDTPELRQQLAEGLGAAEVRVLVQRDRGDLARTVATWVDGYMMRVWQSLRELRPEQEERGAVTLRHTPLALLRMATEPDRERDAQAGELFSLLVVEALDKAFTHAFHNGGVLRLADIAAQRVPVACLTPEVLGHLAERYGDIETPDVKDPHAVDTAFRFGYICATAHALAGTPNPTAARWAYLCLTLYLLSRAPNVVLPEAMLLDTGTHRRLIDFPDAWDVAVRCLLGSPELGKFFEDWFAHVGRTEEAGALVHGGAFRADFSSTPDDTELADRLFEGLQQPTDGTDGLEDALLGSRLTALLVDQGRTQAAERLASLCCEHLAAVENWEALGDLLVGVCEAMNGARQHSAARTLLDAYAPVVMERSKDPRLHMGLWNEQGNALRYLGRLPEALERYDRALEFTHDRPRDRAVVMGNRGIVLRDTGRPYEAIAAFEEAASVPVADAAGKARRALSLAAAYASVNMLDRALEILDEAARLRIPEIHVADQVNLLTAKAEFRAAVGAGGPDFPELARAWALSEAVPGPRLRVCLAVLHCAPRGRVDAEVVEGAVRLAEAVRDGEAAAGGELDQIVVLVRLTEWYRATGDGEQARRTAALLDPVRDALPWDMSWTLARCESDEPVARRWPLMRAVLDALERAVPEHSGDVRMTASWLADKDQVQREIADCAVEAVTAGVADTGALLDVFEFVSGREVLAGAARTRSRAADRAGSVLAHSAGRGIPAALLAFVETTRGVDLLVVRQGGAVLHRLEPGRNAIAAARERFEGKIGGGCLTARQAAAVLDPLKGLFEEVVAAVLSATAAGEQLCLLPSGDLLGLPLHAAPLPDSSLLLERNPVGYAPNLAVLESVLAAGPVPAPGRGPSGVVRVPKHSDRDQFVRRLDDTGRSLLELLGPAAEELAGRAADKESCLRLMATAEHLVMLAHGANSTGADGRGICVADGGELPRAPLPVETVPELRRFLLDASDITGRAAAPPVFVSMACSSGRTFAGSGGSRVGLERALFGSGTRSMIAPLWDVNQSSALDLLRTLYTAWAAGPGVPLGEHYRRAVLDVRTRHPHPFHWAPFALKGSWL